MKLLIVRHGKAGDRDGFAATGQPDELRPLTKDGEREIKIVARALHRVVPTIDTLASSPLTRARQTAEVVSSEYDVPIVDTDALRAESPFEAFETWARRGAHGEMVAAVGHEPHLSGLIAWLIGTSGDAQLALKKGGACLIEFENLPARGSGTLLWLLSPGVVRGMSG